MMFYRGKPCNIKNYGTIWDTLVLYNSKSTNVIKFIIDLRDNSSIDFEMISDPFVDNEIIFAFIKFHFSSKTYLLF
jgi:hypothetical protein